ncbi:toprim domain-containing protein [Bacillus sp. Bos-x628]|uniref:toprim domain-containing protein n=1 Tax=Bacillus maqinnsis TaxID=3229854 RepID=UPI00338E111A
MIIRKNGFEYDIDVDIREELSNFDWHRPNIKGSEMMACSPFRDEHTPSFAVNLETGLWQDFGGFGSQSKGNLITLLSYLRNETPSEIEDYLLAKYGIDLSDVDKLELNVDFSIDSNTETIISSEAYRQFAFRSPYLEKRGISEKIQRAFRIGYDKASKAVSFPWQDIKGNIVNIKFRSTTSKQFFYYPKGQQLKNHIYGLHFIYKLKSETVYLVESEIDALYLWTHGLPAVAIGGSKISDKRKQLLLRSPIKRLVLATDNDAVGEEIRGRVTDMLAGSMEVYEIHLPDKVKDVNDLTTDELKDVCENATPRNIKLF